MTSVTMLTLLLVTIGFVSAGGSRYLASPDAAVRIVDRPNERSLHARPTPRTGGLAILGGAIIGVTLLAVAVRAGVAAPALTSALEGLASRDYYVMLAAVAVLAGMSFWDDVRGLPPAVRLSVQVLVAAFLVLCGDFAITSIRVPMVGRMALGWLGSPITILFIVWLTNLYNFMDGMDGFAGGMTLIGFGFLGWLCLGHGGLDLGFLALVIAAAAGGFLAFNYPPARIFMGDVGAVPLGFLVGAIAAKGSRTGVLDIWLPLIVFSPFIADATAVVVRRALRGAKIWEAHREHYYQRLVLAGWGHRRTVGAEYLLMFTCGLTAVLFGRLGEGARVAIAAAVVLGYVLLARAVQAVEASAPTRETLTR